MKIRRLFPRRKKGVSEIVSYTLLIVIAVIAAILVYNFLKVIVPKNQPQCPIDNNGQSSVRLIVQNYSCDHAGKLNITFQNKGLFMADAVYVRIGNIGKSTKTWINTDASGQFYFQNTSWDPMNIAYTFTKPSLNANSNYTLEVQPARTDTKVNKIAACDATINQIIHCN